MMKRLKNLQGMKHCFKKLHIMIIGLFRGREKTNKQKKKVIHRSLDLANICINGFLRFFRPSISLSWHFSTVLD